jgi:DNA modification methylase
MSIRIIHGECRKELVSLPDQSIHCCVTSPPYFGLRDYGVAGQIGLEPTPQAFITELVAVFREVRRVLRDDATLWLNLGDSYAMRTKGSSGKGLNGKTNKRSIHADRSWRVPDGLKPKDLIGIPWRVAFAMQADGWYLRQDIIWHKPNPMPESVTDRCTKAHEYIFLLSKNARYYYDGESIKYASDRSGEIAGTGPKSLSRGQARGANIKPTGNAKDGGFCISPTMVNKRSVWEVASQPFSEAHFATFPPALIEPCILAGCPKGGTVLDPFAGAGTTGLVADRLQRNAILIELIRIISKWPSNVSMTMPHYW